jgi:hypothetical protein
MQIAKRAGCNHCARAVMHMTQLIPEPEFLNDLPVGVDVRTLEVVEQTATLSDHLEKPTTTVMVLFVGPEVVGQVIDAFGENRDLNASRSGVGLMRPILLDGGTLFESHVLIGPYPRRVGGFNVFSLAPKRN